VHQPNTESVITQTKHKIHNANSVSFRWFRNIVLTQTFLYAFSYAPL